MTDVKTTALNALHRSLGAKMVSFAGYDMPVQFEGLMAEHKHTRAAAGLFDVSHMGQCVVSGDGALEGLMALVPADLSALSLNQQVYSLLMNDNGGIEDDLIICRWAEDTFYVVVNAACKDADFAKLSRIPNTEFKILTSQALVALQGPMAREILSNMNPDVANQTFMTGQFIELLGHRCYVTCSGYTGEDGYEISCPDAGVIDICEALLGHEGVKPIGLGARDSLRLEAGLCLYGHDLDTTTSPIEASLRWAIPKSRRTAEAFVGSNILCEQLAAGPNQKRVGLSIDGRAPVREGVRIENAAGETVGKVTSGTFSPTLGKPIAMAYIETAALETPLFASLRGKQIPVSPCAMPFVPQRYIRAL